ncbi:phenazine biosynthesis-like domain-containing protein 1 [Reticulomyxa filosa]|uniref:Phenazine biosynthesis-like domain-containing protein 1 n=1 Tax=Reticulomyxa filosa TaxID=46433 RepID=X6P8V1_RETFI|nr:phenazine biosynthesis-like domain-containing protein 1 [Reticulomyxa filosa]|eukprot:ETO34484.1 phenazine biosynthesis-like domain-containing protein 1 [Reticulomyxa filosa]
MNEPIPKEQRNIMTSAVLKAFDQPNENKQIIQDILTSGEDLLVVLSYSSLEELKRLNPNISVMKSNESLNKYRCIIVTCLINKASKSNCPYDFVSRVFGPNVGIDEDPVTGSAHSTLAVYWSQHHSVDNPLVPGCLLIRHPREGEKSMLDLTMQKNECI